MGAPIAYKTRQEEMKFLGQEGSPVDSYIAITDAHTGLLTRYLELAEISVVMGDVLFVHGGIRRYNTGWVPPIGSAHQLTCLK